MPPAEVADLARWIITTLLIIAFGIPLFAAASALRKWQVFTAERSAAERKYEIALELGVQEDADRAALSAEGWTPEKSEALMARHQERRRKAGLRQPTAGEFEAELASGRSEYERPHFAPVAEVVWGVVALSCALAAGLLDTWFDGFVRLLHCSIAFGLRLYQFV